MKPILLGRGSKDLFLASKSIFQHGIICGGKGSGKHATARLIVEGWHDSDCSSFLIDISNEFFNLAMPARFDRATSDRAKAVGVDNYAPEYLELSVWRADNPGGGTRDDKREPGNKFRVEPSSFGPELLSYLLNLKAGEREILGQLFRDADTAGKSDLHLDNNKDLRNAVDKFVTRNGSTFINLTEAEQIQFQSDVRFDQLLENLDYLQSRTNLISLGRVGLLPRVYTSLALWILASLVQNRQQISANRQSELKDKELDSHSAGDSLRKFEPLLLVFDEAQILFERGDYLSEFGELLQKCSKSHIGVVFVTNSLAEVPKNIRDHLGFIIHHNIRGRSKRDKEGIEIGINEVPLEKLSFASAVTELRHGEGLVYIRENDLNSRLGEWALLAPARCREEKVTEEEMLSLKIKEVGKHGVPNPYSDESIVKERIRIASSLAGAVYELAAEDSKTSGLNLTERKSIIRGALGIKLK
jgi:hypothetical protein